MQVLEAANKQLVDADKQHIEEKQLLEQKYAKLENEMMKLKRQQGTVNTEEQVYFNENISKTNGN